MSDTGVHVSRLDVLALACGVYPLGRSGRYLRFRSLSGANVAFPVPVSAQVLDGATADDLRTCLRELAARDITPLISPDARSDLGITAAERRLFLSGDHRLWYTKEVRRGWHWNWADAKRRGWLVSAGLAGMTGAWCEWCSLRGRPAVIRDYGAITADVRHLMPTEGAAALGAKINDEITRRYEAVYPGESGPRLTLYDGSYVRVAPTSARETEIIAPILLDAMCAVLGTGPESEAQP